MEVFLPGHLLWYGDATAIGSKKHFDLGLKELYNKLSESSGSLTSDSLNESSAKLLENDTDLICIVLFHRRMCIFRGFTDCKLCFQLVKLILKVKR